MRESAFSNVPWHSRGLAGEMARPIKNFAGNIRWNEGHAEGQSFIGLGTIGGSGRRDQFIGASLVVTAPFVGAKTALTAWGMGAQIEPARTAASAVRTAFGKNPSMDDVRSTYKSLSAADSSALKSTATSVASTPYEVLFSRQGTVYGKAGNITDAAGFFSSMAHRASVQKLAGENPLAMTRPGYFSKGGFTYVGPTPGPLAKNIFKSAVEATVGFASRYIEKWFPGSARYGGGIGWAGGASQAMIGTASRQEAEKARSELERRYPGMLER